MKSEPPMNDVLRVGISAKLADRIRQHGVEAYPYECCGALLGRDNDLIKVSGSETNGGIFSRCIRALVPLVNRRDDSPRNRFSVTADDVLQAEKAAQAQGLEVVGWYHSHPDHPAKPSDFDREHAWPWYSYIIVSVHAGVPQDMTCWQLKDDRSGYIEEKIETVVVSAAS
jgi:proteasome lid subunit RPN8/RPN11